MSSLLTALHTWLRRNAAWSNSRQSWQERLGLAAVLAGATAALTWGRALSLPLQVAQWAGLLLAVAILFRRGWLKLFGPVLFYDMVRVGRRTRNTVYRTLYVLGLLAILGVVYLSWTDSFHYDRGVPAQRMADFAESFFFTFMIVQAVLVLILTPAYVAGSIAEEKERKTLEFLLATDLRNREIVLSKLVSRLANLAMIVLAGLPVLSATQFLGGVEPDLLLACFAIVGLTMMSLAAVSILCSVRARRPRDAIVMTYLTVILYPTLASIAMGLLKYVQFLGTRGSDWPEFWRTVAEWAETPVNVFNAGNLPWLLVLLTEALNRGRSIGEMLPDMVLDYALFHGVVTIVCVIWAVLSLRSLALRETEVRKASGSAALWERAPVSESPMMWKELHAEPRMRLGWAGRILIGILIVCSFIPAWIIMVENMERRMGSGRYGDWVGREMNIWVRIVGTAVACLLLLAVAVRAAGSVSGERDKQTLDALLTSPLETSAILTAKWYGSILSVRWGWLWLGLIWLVGLVTGGLNPCALPMVLVAWLIYAGAFAAVGLWFSVVCRTSLGATVATLSSVLFLGGGHWLLSGLCCFMPMAFAHVHAWELQEMLAKFQAGQTPPVVLGMIAFHGEEFRHSGKDVPEMIFFILIGLVSWGFGTFLLFNGVVARFQKLTGRKGGRVPRMPPHPDRAAEPGGTP